jgi:prepilin-type processing-associated H-X9-DG protein
VARRHGGRANIAFFDGHVGSRDKGALKGGMMTVHSGIGANGLYEIF